MRHNKIIGWETLFEVMDQVQKYSPWLSRQIGRTVKHWPFWLTGLQIVSWEDRKAHTRLPFTVRSTVGQELSQGQLLMGAELCVRLVLLRLAHEIPFRLQFKSSRVEMHNMGDQAVDFRFSISEEEWEPLRLSLARESSAESEIAVTATLADGRAALTATFQIAFQLEKFLTS